MVGLLKVHSLVYLPVYSGMNLDLLASLVCNIDCYRLYLYTVYIEDFVEHPEKIYNILQDATEASERRDNEENSIEVNA
jgi:hypothetical protein